MRTLSNPEFKTLFAVLLMVFAGAVTARVQPAVVGEAAMVVGVARLTNPEGETRALGRGSAIREGDRIETGAGGHVHLRFVDGGRLSVRPASRLQIENYSHAEHSNTATAIRFKLEEGVVRSITGSWGESARDRFRLNTPLAAIGVKGTDFSVAADARQTLVGVYTGAIVLTPMAEGCANTLGPCLTGRERLLSEAMKGQMLAISNQQLTPQLVALGEASPASSSGTNTSRTSHTAAATSANSATVVARTELDAEKQVINEARQVFAENSIVPVVKQLSWMRWPWTQTSATDNVSQAFDAALLKSRELTTTDGAYALLRNNPDGRPMQINDARAEFRLAGATAQLVRRQGPDAVLDPVAVHGGRLSVDFARANFATTLNVSGERLGSQELVSSGQIQSGGVMVGGSGNMGTRGALSTDGREAGYFFSSEQAAGSVRGITLWGR